MGFEMFKNAVNVEVKKGNQKYLVLLDLIL
jgi:hypothetical protein